jgi:hypothetical protein
LIDFCDKRIKKMVRKLIEEEIVLLYFKKKGKMNLTLIFSIIFAFLVISCQSQSSSTSEATTASGDLATTTELPTDRTTSVAQPEGSTESPGPTNSPGPTQSTLEPATQGGSSQNPTVPTTVAPTVPTTEAPTTTQADVWAEFDLDCNTTANYCVYKINAPQIDAATYNEDSSKLQTEKDVYLGLSSKAYYDSSSFFANEVYQNYQNVQELVQNLTMQMQALRDTVDEALADVQNQTAYISDALQNIKATYSNLTTCYYQRCALVTPPPITTTTTPRPTTSDMCSGYSCVTPSEVENNGTCLIISGKPTCQCPGNLDQKNNCAQVGCYSPFTGSDGTVPGPFWSPGFTGSTPVSYGKNLNCFYRITSKDNVKITVKAINLDPTSQIFINNVAVPPIKNAIDLENYIDTKMVKTNTKALTMRFVSKNVPTSGGPYYVDWNVIKHP